MHLIDVGLKNEALHSHKNQRLETNPYSKREAHHFMLPFSTPHSKVYSSAILLLSCPHSFSFLNELLSIFKPVLQFHLKLQLLHFPTLILFEI
jgi:hypothetical protein